MFVKIWTYFIVIVYFNLLESGSIMTCDVIKIDVEHLLLKWTGNFNSFYQFYIMLLG